MTQPTQAQIEAAAKLLKEALPAEAEEKPEFGFGPPETAAAEAGYSEPQGTGFQAGEAELAAAEAGEQRELEIKRLNEIERLYRCIEAYRSELNRAREVAAATIERCTQIVRECGKSTGRDLSDVIAAIRAMNDESNVR